MPRRRSKDLSGLSDNPVCVTDPTRAAKLIAEFGRRAAYIVQHYRMGKMVFGTIPEFNRAVYDLRLATAGKNVPGPRRRLLPVVEVGLSMHARCFANERRGCADSAVEAQDMERAVRHLARHAKPISHRPRQSNVIHHVEGLIILIEDFSGSPVIPRRYRNSEYERHFAPGVSQIVPMIFRKLDPSVSVGQLVSIAERARKLWKDRRPTFDEYFPGYGLKPAPDGSLVSRSGDVIVRVVPNIPTYFH